MKNITHFTLVIALAGSLTACSPGGEAEVRPETERFSEDFSEDVSQVFQPAPKVTIPSGTRLRVTLVDGVNTSKNLSGDWFMAVLADSVTVDEKKVLEKGTRFRGRIVDVNESGRVKGVASIRMILTDVLYHGENLVITTKPFIAEAETTKGRDAGIIAAGAGAGALLGAVADGKKGAGVGALIGGGAGTGAVLATKGKDLDYPPETRLTFILDKPLEL